MQCLQGDQWNDQNRLLHKPTLSRVASCEESEVLICSQMTTDQFTILFAAVNPWQISKSVRCDTTFELALGILEVDSIKILGVKLLEVLCYESATMHVIEAKTTVCTTIIMLSTLRVHPNAKFKKAGGVQNVRGRPHEECDEIPRGMHACICKSMRQGIVLPREKSTKIRRAYELHTYLTDDDRLESMSRNNSDTELEADAKRLISYFLGQDLRISTLRRFLS